MPDRTQHPLSGHQRHGLNNINDGVADTLDDLTKGLAGVLGDLGQGLIDFLNRLTAEKEQHPNDAEKKDAYAKLKSWEQLAADNEKSTMLGKAADFIKGHFEPVENGIERVSKKAQAQGPELVREHLIEIPTHITALPEYKIALTQQRQLLAREQIRQNQGTAGADSVEAGDAQKPHHRSSHGAPQDLTKERVEGDALEPYLRAARQLDAKVLEREEEVEGEVAEIVKVGDQNYYVLEQHGERIAVPAEKEPKHEVGAEIVAARSNVGFEIEEAHGYGR